MLCQVYFAERARGGVGLIVTGGVAPNFTGRVSPFAAQLSFRHQVKEHKVVTSAVHAEGGKIAMQILHAGRYAYHPLSVSHFTCPHFGDFAARVTPRRLLPPAFKLRYLRLRPSGFPAGLLK
jgi:2,4-dienoyl-CoA reductase-like NADH-dependent reductase (Old Yellow Enzyme family)